MNMLERPHGRIDRQHLGRHKEQKTVGYSVELAFFFIRELHQSMDEERSQVEFLFGKMQVHFSFC